MHSTMSKRWPTYKFQIITNAFRWIVAAARNPLAAPFLLADFLQHLLPEKTVHVGLVTVTPRTDRQM
jgi:hypothetical protein